jgi:hypothetical protein
MSSMQNQNNVTRKLSSDVSSADALKMVDELIKEGNTKVTASLINNLRSKYSDNSIIDMIIEKLSERVATIEKRASKFARVVIRKSGEDTPLHSLLNNALKYKDKLKLSDAEFEFFKKNLYNALQHKNKDVLYNEGYPVANTNLSRALGTLMTENINGLNVEQSDFPHLQEIIKHHAVTKQLHASVVFQHFTYKSFAGEALLGTYDSNKHNPSCHINAVIAALFIPKIPLLEETFLLANISHIIKCRYEKRPILTSPEYLLLHSLISDTNDVVCDLDSPFRDLKNRCLLQETLWQSVYALRNGRYYDCISAQFVNAVDNCKLSNTDAPDMIYLGDEGTVMRRLFQAFSFRPIVVSTMPYFGIVNNNIANLPVLRNRISALPMITVRLPQYIPNTVDQEPISLTDQLYAPQYYVENNTLVPKQQTVLYSRGVIVFNVSRRVHQPNYAAMVEPHNWRTLFPTITTFEKANTRSVQFDNQIEIGSNGFAVQTLKLTSVVAINVNPAIPELIVGTRALLVDNKNQNMSKYYMYDPQMASLKRFDEDSNNSNYVTVDPIMTLDYDSAEPVQSFVDIAQKYGTLYVYSVLAQNSD